MPASRVLCSALAVRAAKLRHSSAREWYSDAFCNLLLESVKHNVALAEGFLPVQTLFERRLIHTIEVDA
jgi:hypothetical protein